MKRSLALFAAGVLLAAAAISARAEDKPEPKEGGPRRERMAAMMKEKLGLSDEQFQKFEDAQKKAKESIKPLREALKKAVDRTHGLILLDSSDKEISTALDQVDKARKTLRAEEDKTRAEIEGMLSPRQRAKMLVFHEEMMEHGMQARGMMGRGMMGRGGRPAPEEKPEHGEDGPDE